MLLGPNFHSTSAMKPSQHAKISILIAFKRSCTILDFVRLNFSLLKLKFTIQVIKQEKDLLTQNTKYFHKINKTSLLPDIGQVKTARPNKSPQDHKKYEQK